MKNAILIAFFLLFTFIGYVALKQSMPVPKEKRIYKEIKKYMPYKLEKRFGGLSIVDETTGEKIKPSSAEVLHELDRLESNWGRKHLYIKENKLLVIDDSNNTIATIDIQTEAEMKFIRSFFGI